MGSSANSVADYYCVSHISAATIPSSRLNDILVRMYQGQPLTKTSLDFLQRQNLPGLYRLACGEITHEAYVAGLDTDYLNSYRAAKAANQAKDAERERLSDHYLSQKTIPPVRETAEKRDWEAERNLRRKREREASEAVLRAQRARLAECKVRRERNCELAAAAYLACANVPNYTEPTALELARYFHLEHVAAAVFPPLSDLLKALFRGHALTGEELTYLRHNAPEDLYRLAFGQLTLDGYKQVAKGVEAAALVRKAEQEAAEAARIARENDPEYIAMMQRQALYKKYEVSLIDESLMPRMTKLLQEIDAGHRLPKEELTWLGTCAKKYFSARLRKAYHRLEADFHADQYRLTKDPWSAVNACGHYRKCDQSDTALGLIDDVTTDRLKQPKVRSAVFTTRGGAMRDLRRHSEAIQMGETAHALMPQDYRPCTLLGAVHMELRHFNNGYEWYEKARKLGAPEQGIDSELRGIFQQLDQAGQVAMKRFLLAEDPHRYGWLNETWHQHKKKRSGKENHL